MIGPAALLLASLFAPLLASDARAEKPTVAVLGVSPKADASLVKTTTALDDGLRTQLAAKASPYRVKGTSRQIADAIRSAECSTIEPACAAKLGAALGASFTIAGEAEKRGTHVELVVALVDVAKQRRVRSVRDKVAGNANMRKLARKLVKQLTGEGVMGELVVFANVPRGEIYIDGELKGELFERRATITLPQGRYRLAIRAPGHREFEDLVTVDGSTQVSVLID